MVRSNCRIYLNKANSWRPYKNKLGQSRALNEPQKGEAMKVIILLCSILASSIAFACPDLTGTWDPVNAPNGKPVAKQIKQKTTDQGFTDYTITSVQQNGSLSAHFIADGVTRSDTKPSPNGDTTIEWSADCANDQEFDYQMKLTIQGKVVADGKASMVRNGQTMTESVWSMGATTPTVVNYTLRAQ